MSAQAAFALELVDWAQAAARVMPRRMQVFVVNEGEPFIEAGIVHRAMVRELGAAEQGLG